MWATEQGLELSAEEEYIDSDQHSDSWDHGETTGSGGRQEGHKVGGERKGGGASVNQKNTRVLLD